jgi:hypothetical protein
MARPGLSRRPATEEAERRGEGQRREKARDDKLMPKFMNVSTALARLVEDAAAPVGARVRALRQIDHPTLALLRRLLVDTAKRTIPVPSRLKAVAALKFASEVQYRKGKARNGGRRRRQEVTNALGI